MLQSFIVYGFLGLSLWLLGTIAAIREQTNLNKGKATPFWTWEILFSMLLFATISGIRWKVGTDHLSYLRNYLDLVKGLELKRDSFESGFLFISNLFADLNIHFTIYFSFWAFMQLFFVYYAFKNNRYILPYLGLIILFGGQYLLWMNGIRQTLAACIFVFSIQYITDRKFVKYLLVIFIASLIHKSAIILIALYFMPNLNYFKNRYITITILISAIIIGLNPNWISANEYLTDLLTFLNYDNYSSRLDYLIIEKQEYMAFGPRRMATTALNILIIWFAYSETNIQDDKRQLMYYNLAVIGAIYFNLFANAGHLFLRPSYYLTIFTPIAASYLLSNLKNTKKYSISLTHTAIILISISYLIFAIIADHDKKDLDYTNFKFFWDYYQL